MSLSDKVAIVTGAGSGIGAAIATKFASEGAKVVMVDRNQTKLEDVAEQIEKNGAKTKPVVVVGDVTSEDDCQRILSETLKSFGKLDILVNNAGIGGGALITEKGFMESFDKIMQTNLRAAVYLTHIAAPHLIESKRNIINMSSVTGKGTFEGIKSSYAVSKAALDHFTRCIALELSSKGLRVNAINPGPVKSNILENSGVDKARSYAIEETWKKATALNRFSDAEEIADLAAFLASYAARSITGCTYLADNGCLLKEKCR